MYGGRVIDAFDRRAVATYMGEYMGDFIFDTFQPFHFYQEEKLDYFIPRPEEEKEKNGKKAIEDGGGDGEKAKKPKKKGS